MNETTLFFEMAPVTLPSSKKLRTAPVDDELDEHYQVNRTILAGDDDDEESEAGENTEEGEEFRQDSEEEDEEDDEVEEGGLGSGSQGTGVDEAGSSGDEDGLALDELDDVELHPDVVPRRGVKVVDNKVSVERAQELFCFTSHLECTRKDQEDHPTRPQTALDGNSRSLISGSPYS